LTTLGTIQDAYKSSCNRLGVQFHNNRLEGVDDTPKVKVAVDYDDGYVPPEAVKIFKEHGWDPEKLGIYADEPDEGEGASFEEGTKAYVNLLMWFCGLSIAEFKWEVVEDNLPSFNGYGGICEHFGYGMMHVG